MAAYILMTSLTVGAAFLRWHQHSCRIWTMSQHHSWLLFLSLTTLWSLQSHSHQDLTPDTCPGWQPTSSWLLCPHSSHSHYPKTQLCPFLPKMSVYSVWRRKHTLYLGWGPWSWPPRFQSQLPLAAEQVPAWDRLPSLPSGCLPHTTSAWSLSYSSLAVIAWIMTKASYFVFETALAVLELYVI